MLQVQGLTQLLLLSQADKSTIVEAAISMIRGLETTIKKLQKKKMENIRGPLLHSAQHWQATCELSREALMADQVKSLPLISSSESTFPLCFQTWSSPNVVVSMSGVDVHINVCAVRKRGLMSNIVYSLEKHNLLVLSAHVSCDYFRSMFMIHAQVSTKRISSFFPSHSLCISIQSLPFLQANGIREPLEEIFMSAVGEIMAWIS